jgi:hypothetical protein
MKMATKKQGEKFVEKNRESGTPREQIQRFLASTVFPVVMRADFDELEKHEDKFRALCGLPPNSIIKIDRWQTLIYPVYPDFVIKPLHPDLENKGPKQIDLDPRVKQVEQWLHPDQENGWVKGQIIYDHQISTGELEICFGLRELLAIQARGPNFFRCYFKGKSVFGWKGVVLDSVGRRHVPCLFIEDGREVRLSWRWLEGHWSSYTPALRFAR